MNFFVALIKFLAYIFILLGCMYLTFMFFDIVPTFWSSVLIGIIWSVIINFVFNLPDPDE